MGIQGGAKLVHSLDVDTRQVGDEPLGPVLRQSAHIPQLSVWSISIQDTGVSSQQARAGEGLDTAPIARLLSLPPKYQSLFTKTAWAGSRVESVSIFGWLLGIKGKKSHNTKRCTSLVSLSLKSRLYLAPRLPQNLKRLSQGFMVEGSPGGSG